MLKSDRIGQLLDHDFFSNKEIAAIVEKEFGSCCEEYVRSCIQRRRGGGLSKADKAYAAKFVAEHGVTLGVFRYRNNPEPNKASAKKWKEENRERYLKNQRRYNAKYRGRNSAAKEIY